MLARVQAEDMADLAGAENTLNRFCERPEAPLRQVTAAFTQLADWHMQAADVEAARRCWSGSWRVIRTRKRRCRRNSGWRTWARRKNHPGQA